ncbi:MAG: DUF3971 domain-containing protein [Gammaproteobacteria bacterium]|nr:DUF3971 domain-containing protein [Gammaproteobacteria bacterium]
MLELARKSFYVATVLIVLCTFVLSTGRLLSSFPTYVQQFANTKLEGQGIELVGLKSHWRLINPIIEIDRIDLPEGSASNVLVEVAVLESLIRNQFVARRLTIEALELDIDLSKQQSELDFLGLIYSIQSNFEWVRHTDQLGLSATLTLRRDLTNQRFKLDIEAVNQDGVHRYRANLEQDDRADGGSAEFVADAVDTLLDLRTGDYQMSLKVEGLEIDLPLLTGNTRLPTYTLTGDAEWEKVERRVQGHVELDVTHIHRKPLTAHIETTFVQVDDEPARFRLQDTWLDDDEHTVPLPDLVFAIGDDSLFGSTYNVQLQELVPIVTDFVTTGDERLRWPTAVALEGTFQRYEFLLDAGGFHWYAEALDMSSESFENLPQMQLESGVLYGNSKQIALDASNSPSRLFLDTHFQSPWRFSSVSGFAVTDIREQQVGLHISDFAVHIAPEETDRSASDSQLDVSSLLRRERAEIQLEELIHEPVSALFRGSIRHTRGDVPDYRVAILVKSQNTLLPAHQTIEFIPSNLVDDLTRWRQQYLEDASFFGTRVSYMTFRDKIFAQNEREMHIEGQFTNGTVTYQEDWPPLSNVGGIWSVNNDSVVVSTDRVTVQNTELENAVATFPFGTDKPFHISFAATTKAQDLVDFVQVSGLKSLLPAIDASWRGEGLVSIEADLLFPFVSPLTEGAEIASRTTNHQIKLELHDTTLYMPNFDIEFHELNGNATWNSPFKLEASFTRGTFFDESMEGNIVSLSLDEQPVIEFHLSSRISAEEALKIAGLEAIESGNGATDFEAILRVYPDTDAPTELILSSDLMGIEFDTLKSVASKPDEPNPSDLQLVFQENQTEITAKTRDINGWVVLTGAPASVLEGAFALGQSKVIPERLPNQLHLTGTLDSWVYGTDEKQQLDVPIILTDVALDRFMAFDHGFANVAINGLYSNDQLDVAIESDEFTGTIVKRSLDANTEIHASKVIWSLVRDSEGDDPLDVSVLSQIEPTDVSIDDLTLKTDDEVLESWGNWEFTVAPTDYGIEISNLVADTRGLRIESTSPIEWNRETNTTEFNGRFYGEDLGTILEDWEFDASVESEQFEVDANIQWPGSPLAIDIENSSGQFRASASNGRFLEIDQGGDMLRIISLLNFSKILNRLALDFRDVTQQGLHYDTVSVAATLNDGFISFQEPLRIDGPSVRLRLSGSIDTRSGALNNELTARIPLNKGLQTYAAYLAATNPASTVAFLLTTLIINEPVKALFTMQYEITGDLDNPILTRVGMEPTPATQVATP